MIESPQIVNGLQTSKQIATHIQSNNADNRSVMVKIISSEDEETRDKIIKATNSQNRVQPATLRATDKVQRNIEDALKSANLYYDRRKNYYKNRGKPRDRIISISLMAQATMSIILGKPDSARARPSSLIKSDKDYYAVFSENCPLSFYVNAASLIRKILFVLSKRSEMTARDRTNLRFYVLYWLTSLKTKSVRPKANQVANVNIDAITNDDIESAIDAVWAFYVDQGRNDSVAKGPNLINKLRQEISKNFGYHTQKD